MSDRDRFFDLAIELARAAQENGRRARHRHRHRQRQRQRRRRGQTPFMRWLNAVLQMLASGIIIPVVVVCIGLLIGQGYKGLIAAPLGVLAAWGVILFFTLRTRVTPRTIARADIAQLPEQTGEWLERQRPRLPFAAHSTLESIAVTLEGLGPQVKGLDANLPEAVEVRRLIGEELPALVDGYLKLPEPLRRQPLHDGPSPEQRLIEGLSTIDEQVGRVHHRLAEGDLYKLATHQRYLQLKYKDDDELE